MKRQRQMRHPESRERQQTPAGGQQQPSPGREQADMQYYGGGYGGAPAAGQGSAYRQQEALQPGRPGYGESGGGRAGGAPGLAEQYGQYGQEDFGHGGFGPGGYGGYGREEEQHYGQGRASPAESYRPLPGEGVAFESGGRQQQGFGWGEQSYGRHQRFEGGQGSFRSAQLPAELGQEQEVGGFGAYHQGGWLGRSDLPRERKGPKHYERSDERIREFICERLAQYQSLDVSEVSVEVDGGCVALEGTVPERRMKHLIEDVAAGCWGVKDVENRIRVAAATSAGEGPGKHKESGL